MDVAPGPEADLRSVLLEKISREPGRYLFRGQRRDFPRVVPSIARAEGIKLGQAYTILRRTVAHYRGQIWPSELRGWIKADPVETIALMQHYGWPTPYIDLTDDPDVAFFFAHDGYAQDEGPAVMLIVDRLSLPSECKLVAHEEVVDPELNIRWSRQKGYALRPANWIDMDNCRNLDLRNARYVEVRKFQPATRSAEESAQLHASHYPQDIAVMQQLGFLVRGIAELCEFENLDPDLERFPY